MNEVLSQSYNRETFFEFLKELFPAFNRDTRQVSTATPSFKSIHSLGSLPELDLQLFEVKVSGSLDKRVSIATDAFRLMKSTASYRTLVAFHSEDTDQWRLSFMTAQPTLKDGKVITKLSNPRRYSYLLGPGSKLATPTKQLVSKGKVVDYEDLSKRFAVEVVNNEFYKEIAKLYDELVGTDKIHAALRYPSPGEQSHEFAVRLIGRIIFCWFLREKRSANGTPLVPEEILSRHAADEDNYYHSTLAPLFFEVLNKHLRSREPKFQEQPYSTIPYLNGGLFNPDADDHYRFDKTLQLSVPGLVDVPDTWLHKLFDLLELYNFTVDENTSYDIDLSIDPEMLGRIFENLLARINPETGETVRKMTGSFYTPREIVEYMVDESLKEYLKNETQISEAKLVALTSFDLSDDEEQPLTAEEKRRVTTALSKIKILDPACGSGAFPIGALQKIVFMLQQVDSEARHWFEQQLTGASPELRHHLEREYKNKNFDYLRKLGIIRESIYGIDIQPIATEISRLRCFLTLIVDQSVEDTAANRGVEPLPNLDFKFVTANSLIALETDKPKIKKEQTGLFEDQTGIDDLKVLRDEYFTSHNAEREVIKSKFLQAQNQMLQRMLSGHHKGFADITQKLSSWSPFSHKVTNWFEPDWMFGITDGFDIVIANPPYYTLAKGRGQKTNIELIDTYKDLFASFEYKGNTFSLFYERGLDLTSGDNGILTYITPDTLLLNNSFSKLRQLLLERVNIRMILNVKAKVFGDAEIGGATVLVVVKPKSSGSHTSVVLSYDSKITNKVKYSVEQNLFEEAPAQKFILDPSRLKTYQKIIAGSKPLKSEVSFYNGIKTGNNKLFLSKARDSNLHRLAIRGRDFTRYSNADESTYVLYDKSKLWSNFDEDKLTAQPRLLIRQTADRIVATYEQRSKGLPLDTVHIIYNFNIDPHYLLGLMNSKLTTWIYRTLTNEEGRTFAEIKIVYLKELPYKAHPVLSNKVASLVKEIMKSKMAGDSDDTSQLEDSIDRLIYKIYGLSEEEISIIESHG